MNIKSEQLESVSCVIGQKTRKPNTVTMTVSSNFIIEVVTLFEQLKVGKKPTKGLCGLKLIAEYVEDIEDEEKQLELVEGMAGSLEEITHSEYKDDHSIDIETGDIDGLDEMSIDIDDSEQDEFHEGEK